MNKGHGSKDGAQSWLGIWGLPDWIYCVYSQTAHLQRTKCCLKFWFVEVALQA